MLTVGAHNTLPLEIYAMTTSVTSPALFALGTLTTALSFLVIAIAIGSMALDPAAPHARCADGRRQA